MIICLDRPLPDGSSDLPEGRRAALCLLFGLASDGACPASCIAAGAVVSYTAVSPLPLCRKAKRRSVLCGAFPGVASAGRYPASCPVKPGLSSRPEGPAIIRPAPQSHIYHEKPRISRNKSPDRSPQPPDPVFGNPKPDFLNRKFTSNSSKTLAKPMYFVYTAGIQRFPRSSVL